MKKQKIENDSVYTVLVDYERRRIGINKAAQRIDKIYNHTPECEHLETVWDSEKTQYTCTSCGRDATIYYGDKKIK